MELTNILISTEYNYPQDRDIYSMDSEKEYYLKLQIPIPGGEAIYKIKTSREINESIEKASNLK